MNHLFQKINFISHANQSLDWKIECDSLTDDDLKTLAYVISQKMKFGSVYGIPRGGIRLAECLKHYCNEGPRLLVDDVLTTGNSMKENYQEGDIGVVIFARGKCPDWIIPVFQCGL